MFRSIGSLNSVLNHNSEQPRDSNEYRQITTETVVSQGLGRFRVYYIRLTLS